MEEIDYYLDKFINAHKEWREAENNLHDYWKQFWYSEGDGRDKMMFLRSPNNEDWKKIEGLGKELDKKQINFRKIEQEWKLFCDRIKRVKNN